MTKRYFFAPSPRRIIIVPSRLHNQKEYPAAARIHFIMVIFTARYKDGKKNILHDVPVNPQWETFTQKWLITEGDA